MSVWFAWSTDFATSYEQGLRRNSGSHGSRLWDSSDHGENLRERGKGQGKPLPTKASGLLDHVDRQALVNPIGRAVPAKRYIQGDIAARTGERIAVKPLHMPRWSRTMINSIPG
jgi:hypothetical protein